MYDIHRVYDITQGFAHLTTMCIPEYTMEQHL